MITAISWVPKGVCKPVPFVAEPPSEEEIEGILKEKRIAERAKSDSQTYDEVMEDDEVTHAVAAADAPGKTPKETVSGTNLQDINDCYKELDMEHYDEDNEGTSSGFGNLYYPSNKVDPFLKDNDGNDSESEEIKDMAIKPMDAVIVCAVVKNDVNNLEVNIYEDSNDYHSNLYAHHYIIVQGNPLCTAWLDCPLKGGEKGNFVAIGSDNPSIEIWDLDVIDEVQPSVILGGIADNNGKASLKFKEGSHTNSVLDLAWNKKYRNILASASADKLVKIWDVDANKCNITMKHHKNEVQAIAWNHFMPQVLLSGSFDRSVVMKDGRIPSHTGFKWLVTASVQSLEWDPHSEHSFVVSLKDGTVKSFDIRAATSDSTSESRPSFTIHAHDKAVYTVSYNPLVPNLLASGSRDEMVKLWDISNNQPSCIASQNPNAGAVLCISFSEDDPFLLAIGGSKNNLLVWNTLSDAGVSRRFGSYRNQKRPDPCLDG